MNAPAQKTKKGLRLGRYEKLATGTEDVEIAAELRRCAVMLDPIARSAGGTASDSGQDEDCILQRLETFREDVQLAVTEVQAAMSVKVHLPELKNKVLFEIRRCSKQIS